MAAAGWLSFWFFLLHVLLDDMSGNKSCCAFVLVNASGGAPDIRSRCCASIAAPLVAVAFFFIRFPVLVTNRRRALQDFLTITVVIYDMTQDIEKKMLTSN